jgi:hypothetical protein
LESIGLLGSIGGGEMEKGPLLHSSWKDKWAVKSERGLYYGVFGERKVSVSKGGFYYIVVSRMKAS